MLSPQKPSKLYTNTNSPNLNDMETPTNSSNLSFMNPLSCNKLSTIDITPKANIRSKSNAIALMKETQLKSGSKTQLNTCVMKKSISISNQDSNTSACTNFEAFSHNFHLPLKIAAEKFGVRATAFKKRCRAIGIRHWPYRKVRSLRRSLQELARYKEQGTLSEKQQYQFTVFKKQLNRLMTPQTYGIDPSGKLPVAINTCDSDDNEDSQEDENEEVYTSIHSPQIGATFDECTISPMENDKTFGDFISLGHLRSFRKQIVGGIAVSDYKGINVVRKHVENEVHSNKNDENTYRMYRPSINFDNDDDRLRPSSGYTGYEFITTDVKAEDIRSEVEDSLFSTYNAMDYTNERFFDDVFLQISPDYGCLV